MDAFLIKTARTPSVTQRSRRQKSSEKAPIEDRSVESRPPPAKRARHEEIPGSDEDSDNSLVENSVQRDSGERRQGLGNRPENQDDTFEDDLTRESRPTAIESSLPDVSLDGNFIQEYEEFRASQSQEEPPEGAASRLDSRKWVRGRSSIYVDAFNLALETVLEEESHLFDDKERFIFQQWQGLSYEAQFLYVRLFLRKTDQWYRIARLGYHNDIVDLNSAVKELQKPHVFPKAIIYSKSNKEDGTHQNPPTCPDDECLVDDGFVFADSSDENVATVELAITLLTLDEVKALAKESKVQGKNKADLTKSICKASRQQAGLFSLGLRRASTADSTTSNGRATPDGELLDSANDHVSREKRLLEKILAITGPCIHLSSPLFKLFERVHLVFYRSTEWTEKSLTAIILSKISKRNFPQYIVCRSTNIFTSRAHLLEFETAMRTEYSVDNILEFNGPVREPELRKVLAIFEGIYSRWRELLREERQKEERVYEFGEGAYLRRLNPAYSYTRIVHKAADTLGRVKEHLREHALLTELLDQRLFHLAKRGAWYQRKALLEEHYMYALKPDDAYQTAEQQKKHWKRIAVATCETALEDRDCHLKYHYDIQKRIVKLEKQLKIPKRLQHDFGHVRLQRPEEHYVQGIQLKKSDLVGKNGKGPSTKTIWVDEAEDGAECSVEAMCLSHYRGEGWKGYHAEGGILRTLFAYLFYDILFIYIPNVFQTAYQTCPLDLHTDAFYPARASEINHRLVEIANGVAPRLIEEVDQKERQNRTCVVGLNWDYELSDLLELAGSFDGAALAAVCKVMAQEYGQRGGGIPDLILWRTEPAKECMFAEVKSANDRLSDTQRLWIHVLMGAGVRVALCNAAAKEIREV